MRAWKIHLCWGLVTIVTAGAWGRWTVASREANGGGHLGGNAVAREEPAQAQSDPSAPTGHVPSTSIQPSTLRPLLEPLDLPVGEIRVRMRSSNVEDAHEAVKLITKLKDRRASAIS